MISEYPPALLRYKCSNQKIQPLSWLTTESNSSLGNSSASSGDDSTLKVAADPSPRKKGGDRDVPDLDNSSSLDSDSGLLNDSDDSDTVIGSSSIRIDNPVNSVSSSLTHRLSFRFDLSKEDVLDCLHNLGSSLITNLFRQPLARYVDSLEFSEGVLAPLFESAFELVPQEEAEYTMPSMHPEYYEGLEGCLGAAITSSHFAPTKRQDEVEKEMDRTQKTESRRRTGSKVRASSREKGGNTEGTHRPANTRTFLHSSSRTSRIIKKKPKSLIRRKTRRATMTSRRAKQRTSQRIEGQGETRA